MRSIGIGHINGTNAKTQLPLQRGSLQRKITPKEGPSTNAIPPGRIREENEGQLAVDIYQTDTEFVITAPIAGVSKEAVTITVSDDVLTIHGTRVPPEEIEPQAYLTHECFWGNFSRSIVLPETVDTTKIQATFKNSVLSLRIPKIERIRTRIITIRS